MFLLRGEEHVLAFQPKLILYILLYTILLLKQHYYMVVLRLTISRITAMQTANFKNQYFRKTNRSSLN
jgi:hypothetical protein